MLTVTVSGPEQTDVFTDVGHVCVPAARGTWCIHPLHAESFMTLQTGTMHITYADGRTDVVLIETGTCHVFEDTVLILV